MFEIFTPSNFFDMASLLANILTGLVAVTALLIASATYYTAREALGVWKKEKEFDINIEGRAASFDAIRLLQDLKLEQFNPEGVKKAWSDVLSDIFEKDELEVYRSFIRLFSYSDYYNSLKDRMFDMRKHAMKVLNVSTDRELVDYYAKYISVESNLFAIHHNYHISVINEFIDKYQYTKFMKEDYAVCIYFNSVKAKEPNTPDMQLYRELYNHFFNNIGGDPLENMRQQQVSFIYSNLKSK